MDTLLSIVKQIREGDFQMTKDAIQLQNIFPEELWLHILDTLVDDAFQLECVSNASPFFSRLLKPKRVLFLFPKVLDVMAVRYKLLCIEDSDDDPLSTTPSKDHLPEILKLRLVCRAWTKAVDDYMQRDEYHTRLRGDSEEETSLNMTMYWTTARIHFHNAEEFTEHFGDTHDNEMEEKYKNPFIGRSVNIDFEIPPIFEGQQPQNIDLLLTKYGYHIWYVRILIPNDFPSLVELYARVKKLLHLMPSLKSLRITYFSDHNPYSTDDLAGVAAEMISRPLHKLDGLTHFRTFGLPGIICNGILSSNNHIGFMDLDYNDICWSYDVFSRPFPNVVQMAMEINNLSEFSSLEVTRNEWKLRKLNFSFDRKVFIQWDRIFSLLESKWGDSMTNLVLHLPKAGTRSEKKNILKKCTSSRLNLPNIKRLKVSIVNLSSLDFLLPMKNSLEILHANLEYDERLETKGRFGRVIQVKQEIEFLGFTYKLDNSNIWKKFPRLKKVVIVEQKASKAGRVDLPSYVCNTYKRNCKKETEEMDWFKYIFSRAI